MDFHSWSHKREQVCQREQLIETNTILSIWVRKKPLVGSLSVREKACWVPHWVSWIAFRNTGTQGHTTAGWLCQQEAQRRVILMHWQKRQSGAYWFGACTWIYLINTLALQLESRVGRKGDYVNMMSYFVLLKTEHKSLILKHQVQAHAMYQSPISTFI